jgi:hypothetical protein
MVTCGALVKRERKLATKGANVFRVPSDNLLNLCHGKPGTVLFYPACAFKGSHLLAGYSMETAMHIMRGKRILPGMALSRVTILFNVLTKIL